MQKRGEGSNRGRHEYDLRYTGRGKGGRALVSPNPMSVGESSGNEVDQGHAENENKTSAPRKLTYSNFHVIERRERFGGKSGVKFSGKISGVTI